MVEVEPMTSPLPEPELPDEFQYFRDHANQLASVDALEMLTLRGHLLVEAALRAVLAARLRADADDLPRLNFSTLAELALLGVQAKNREAVTRSITLLNAIRNDLAHRLAPGDQTVRLREFVSVRPDAEWPLTSPEQMKSYCRTLQYLVGFLNGAAHVLAAHRVRSDTENAGEPKGE